MVHILVWLLGASFTDAAIVIHCRTTFSTPFGEIHSSFPHNTRYASEVPRTEIKAQCNTGHCHMYSWLAELEIKSGIRLSSTYLDAMIVYYRTLDALNSKSNTVGEGNDSVASRRDIRRMGLVPLEAWKGQDDFIKAERYKKLSGALETILIHTLDSAKEESSPDAVTAIYRQARSQIQELINNMAGPFPKEFIYNGETYTPRSFAKKFFPELYLPAVEVTIYPEIAEPKVTPKSKSHTLMEMNWDRAESLMTALIDSGQPLYLGYNHHRQFVDEATGIMSISAFNYPPMATGLSRKQVTDHGKWIGSHASLIVGYDRDPNTGKVLKWKIQNSWDTDSGDQGYFHMYRDYFHYFAYTFTFFNEGKVDIHKELNLSP